VEDGLAVGTGCDSIIGHIAPEGHFEKIFSRRCFGVSIWGVKIMERKDYDKFLFFFLSLFSTGFGR
jgi:hypothetical protein